MKSFLTAVILTLFFSTGVYAQTGDTNTLLQIANGDKLVLRKDFFLPANTNYIDFGVVIDSGYLATGCRILLKPSQNARKIPQQSELVFSGENKQEVTKNEFGNTDYRYTAMMSNSQSVAALECYGTSFRHYGPKSLYISGMKENLKDTFDFVPTEPEITD
jgi:hypothetical protein